MSPNNYSVTETATNAGQKNGCAFSQGEGKLINVSSRFPFSLKCLD